VTQCRICSGQSLFKFLDLGQTPLANGFIEPDDLASKEERYPLVVYFCENCGLVQLLDVVPPTDMFEDYPYITGASSPMRDHFHGFAQEVTGVGELNETSLVVDIGSNDGTLLSGFDGVRILGVEPAKNISKIANDAGIKTLNEFFSTDVAKQIVSTHGKASVVLATNVFAHVNDASSFLEGVKILLTDEGHFTFEVPYLLDMIQKPEFDTIYHEHLSYFAIRPLMALFKRFEMDIVDVKRIPVHGGSIRVYVKNGLRAETSDAVSSLLQTEEAEGLHSKSTYTEFGSNVAELRTKLLELLEDLKNDGASIADYGASAKGNILLNYCGIGTEKLSYIVDTTPLKQGRFSPGVHIPVVHPDQFAEQPPDYTLLLAWNYAEAILAKEAEYRRQGGKFIIPVPTPVVV